MQLGRTHGRTLTIIEKICKELNCNIGDRVEIVPQDLER